MLKSPTTHPTDKVIAPELAELAGVNLEEYGLAMLKAGTNLASKSAEELIDIDAKTFELNGNNVRVAQVNTVDIAEVLERKAEIEAAIEKAIADNGYSDFVLMITDIINSDSEILAIGSNMDKVEAAFNFALENNHAFKEENTNKTCPGHAQATADSKTLNNTVWSLGPEILRGKGRHSRRNSRHRKESKSHNASSCRLGTNNHSSKSID